MRKISDILLPCVYMSTIFIRHNKEKKQKIKCEESKLKGKNNSAIKVCQFEQYRAFVSYFMKQMSSNVS